MKKIKLFTLLLLSASLVGLNTGCSKENEEVNDNDVNTSTQINNDEQFVDDESDRILDEANTFVMQGMLKSSDEGDNSPCNANLDSVRIVNDTMVFYVTYNGLSCNGKINRTGKAEIRIKQGTFWIQPGAVKKIKLINYTATRVATGKSVTLNGEKTHVNVTGGHVGLLGITYDTIIHEVTGHITAAFDNGTTREWNIARRKVFSGSQGNIQVAFSGFGEAGEYNHLVTWGIDRMGNQFYTQIVEPVITKQTCDWDPVAGIKKHYVPERTLTITTTFGFDDNNQPVASGECPTKYKLEVERNGKLRTLYLPLN
ncbi:MAG: hypothetical protein HPY80_00020 [Bacteroidales bacterium]|nr:hypothetical protein [Bacteroidales bacterium]NPV35031.1 hypothetical protein [Bacteroidales bacterium]